jgi:putative tricarboxylic transport membrane protein
LSPFAGIYYGQYGGSTTAILVNIPGESSPVVTTLDGRRWRAAAAPGPRSAWPRYRGCIATLLIA